jgi:hypothetical protein
MAEKEVLTGYAKNPPDLPNFGKGRGTCETKVQ